MMRQGCRWVLYCFAAFLLGVNSSAGALDFFDEIKEAGKSGGGPVTKSIAAHHRSGERRNTDTLQLQRENARLRNELEKREKLIQKMSVALEEAQQVIESQNQAIAQLSTNQPTAAGKSQGTDE